MKMLAQKNRCPSLSSIRKTYLIYKVNINNDSINQLTSIIFLIQRDLSFRHCMSSYRLKIFHLLESDL